MNIANFYTVFRLIWNDCILRHDCCVQELDVHNRDTKTNRLSENKVTLAVCKALWYDFMHQSGKMCPKCDKKSTVCKFGRYAYVKGSQWGLIVVPMFCPLKYPIQPCTAQIFAVAEDASPGTIFWKSWKDFLRGRRGRCPFRNPTSTF